MEFYEGCAVPKPGSGGKDKKKANGYKDKPNRKCCYTGAPNAERHEIYCGASRQTSIDQGFQIDVCPDIHRALQQNLTEWARKENKRWRKHFQREYEKKLTAVGVDSENARKTWFYMMGKSYL